MIFFKTVTFAIAMFIGGQAQAWTATAISNGHSFISYNNDTPQQAETEALKGCRSKSDDCKLIGKPLTGTAVVLARGIGGWGHSANPTPQVAANNALASCKKNAKNCTIDNIVWDSGATWSASAIRDDAFFVHINAATQKEAETKAIQLCEKNSSEVGSCKIHKEMSTNAHAYYAKAHSKSSQGLGLSETPVGAKRQAMEACENGLSKGDACIVEIWVENSGPKAEPVQFQKLVAQIEKAKIQQSKAVISKVKSETFVECTNQCFNGSCIRTFKNGRKEKWQAPRTFDPFTNNSGWDLTTNACGQH